MNREDFERLVNREIDGLLTPEEEASLNDYTSRDSAAAHEQRSLHKIHRAFQQMDRHETPVGLADRIADRVLAEPAPVRRFTTPGMLNKVAAAILVLTVVGFGGWWIGNTNPASAGEPDKVRALHEWREETLRVWQETWDLTEAQARQILEIKEHTRVTASDNAADLESGRVLAKLKEFGILDRYCKKHSLPREEADQRIERAATSK
jgi:hypothetical protein